MPPSFYDSSSSSPTSLPASGAPYQSTSASDGRLPTLAVVLGLIGSLVTLAIIARICIYIFRGRLVPAVEPVDEKEKPCASSKEDQLDIDRSSYFSELCDTDGMLAYDALDNGVMKDSWLSPHVLKPAGSDKPHYKELLLPRLQQVQSSQSVSHHSTTTKTKRLTWSYSFGMANALLDSDTTSLRSMQTSRSCPASLSTIPYTLNVSVACSNSSQDHSNNGLKVLQLVSKFSPSLDLISSSDSNSSVYSEDSSYSSSSGESLPWDYYINNSEDDLFYKPEPLPTPVLSAFESHEALYSAIAGSRIGETCSEEELNVNLCVDSRFSKRRHRRRLFDFRVLPLSKRPTLVGWPRKRPSVLCVNSYWKKSQAMSSAIKTRNVKSQAARFLRASQIRRNVQILDSCLSDLPMRVRYTQLRRSCARRKTPLGSKSRARARGKAYDSPTRSSGTNSQTSSPRCTSRQPFGVITNVLTPPRAKRSPKKAKTTSPQRTRPLLLLNGVAGGDLVTSMPQRFNRHASPPRNPTLLNTRWMPRPAVPPLMITVFAKRRSVVASKYPGRRVTLTPPAGTSLAELRGVIERALGHEVRALRGMVFIGSRSMFLPILSERFYAQWVKERVRDGGVGIVEAWHH